MPHGYRILIWTSDPVFCLLEIVWIPAPKFTRGDNQSVILNATAYLPGIPLVSLEGTSMTIPLSFVGHLIFIPGPFSKTILLPLYTAIFLIHSLRGNISAPEASLS